MSAESHPITEAETQAFSSKDLGRNLTLVPPVEATSNEVYDSLAVPIEAAEAFESTDPRIVTANLNIFVDKLHMRDRAVGIYCSWKGVNKRSTSMAGLLSGSRSDVAAQAEAAFEDLFNGTDITSFRRDYGGDADGFIKIKDDVEKAHEAFAETTLANIDQITTKDRVSVALKTLKEVPGLSDEQKEELLAVSGYSADAILLIAKRLKGSIPLYGALYATSDWASDGLGILGGIAKPLENNQITDPKTLAAVLGSAGVYYAVKYSQAVQAEHMLQDENITRIPNPSAVIGYYLAQKLFPGNERAQKWITRMSYVANPFEFQQERWWAWAPVNPSIFVAGNIVSIAINAAQIGAMEFSRRQEIWQATRNREGTHSSSAEVIEDGVA